MTMVLVMDRLVDGVRVFYRLYVVGNVDLNMFMPEKI